MIHLHLHPHSEGPIQAKAWESDQITWLTISFGKHALAEVTIFMPLDRAQRLADAINQAETNAWAPLLPKGDEDEQASDAA